MALLFLCFFVSVVVCLVKTKSEFNVAETESHFLIEKNRSISSLPDHTRAFEDPQAPLDLANWMNIKKDSLWNLTLQDMTILGTHDSGAYNLTHDMLPGFILSSTPSSPASPNSL